MGSPVDEASACARWRLALIILSLDSARLPMLPRCQVVQWLVTYCATPQTGDTLHSSLSAARSRRFASIYLSSKCRAARTACRRTVELAA